MGSLACLSPYSFFTKRKSMPPEGVSPCEAANWFWHSRILHSLTTCVASIPPALRATSLYTREALVRWNSTGAVENHSLLLRRTDCHVAPKAETEFTDFATTREALVPSSSGATMEDESCYAREAGAIPRRALPLSQTLEIRLQPFPSQRVPLYPGIAADPVCGL